MYIFLIPKHYEEKTIHGKLQSLDKMSEGRRMTLEKCIRMQRCGSIRRGREIQQFALFVATLYIYSHISPQNFVICKGQT